MRDDPVAIGDLASNTPERPVSASDRARYAELFDALYDGQGLAVLADIASGFFGGNPLAIVDTGMAALALSNNFDAHDDILGSHLERGFLGGPVLRAAKVDKLIERLHTAHSSFLLRPQTDPSRGIPRLRYGMALGPVRAHGVVVAYVAIFGLHSPFDDTTVQWLDFVRRIISVELQKDSFLTQNSSGGYESLLVDLLEHRLVRKDVLAERLSVLGRRLNEDLYVMTVRNSSGEQSRRALRHAREALLRSLSPANMAIMYRNDIVFLLGHGPGEPPMGGGHEVRSFLQGNGFQAGISDVFSDPDRVRDAYLQSLNAIELGQTYSPGATVHQYPTLAFHHVLAAAADEVDLTRLVHPGLLRLHRSGAEADRALLETLALHLSTLKDVSRVASRLHIHRNTVFYRINRVQDLTGIDLTDDNAVFQVLLSIKVLGYLDATSRATSTESASPGS